MWWGHFPKYQILDYFSWNFYKWKINCIILFNKCNFLLCTNIFEILFRSLNKHHFAFIAKRVLFFVVNPFLSNSKFSKLHDCFFFFKEAFFFPLKRPWQVSVGVRIPMTVWWEGDVCIKKRLLIRGMLYKMSMELTPYLSY